MPAPARRREAAHLQTASSASARPRSRWRSCGESRRVSVCEPDPLTERKLPQGDELRQPLGLQKRADTKIVRMSFFKRPNTLTGERLNNGRNPASEAPGSGTTRVPSEAAPASARGQRGPCRLNPPPSSCKRQGSRADHSPRPGVQNLPATQPSCPEPPLVAGNYIQGMAKGGPQL